LNYNDNAAAAAAGLQGRETYPAVAPPADTTPAGSPPPSVSATRSPGARVVPGHRGPAATASRPGTVSGTGEDGAGNYIIRQVLELFQGRLIEAGGAQESRGKRPFTAPDLWMAGEQDIPLPEPPPEEDDEL